MKTIVITGASDGIGAAAARRLVADGHQVVVVGRSPGKTAAVAAELDAPYRVADFSRLSEVRELASWLGEHYPHIDVLANNAGFICGAHRVETPDGHEATFQVNYLAPFLLTALLRDQLIDSRAVVVETSSMAHWGGRLDLDDLDHERSYSPMRAYSDSKLALILHARELQYRYGSQGLTAVTFHPGVIASNFANGMGTLMSWAYSGPLASIFPDPDAGADSLVFLAESDPADIPPGGYIIRRKPSRTLPSAWDERLAHELWAQTEQILGLV